MIISSRGVLLCSCVPGQPAAQAASSGSSSAAVSRAVGVSVEKVQLVQWVLCGVPLSCAAVSDHSYVIGDDRAGGEGCLVVRACPPLACGVTRVSAICTTCQPLL